MSLLRKLVLEMDPPTEPYGGIAQLDRVSMAVKNHAKDSATPFARYMMQRSSVEGEEESDMEDFGHIYDMIKEGGLSKEEFISMMSSHEDLEGVEDPLVSDDEQGIQLDKSMDQDPGDHEYR